MIAVDEQLALLAMLPNVSFSLTWNEHRLVYAEARGYEPYQPWSDALDWDADIWSLSVYRRTPIVFDYFVSNDLASVLDAAITELELGTSGE